MKVLSCSLLLLFAVAAYGDFRGHNDLRAEFEQYVRTWGKNYKDNAEKQLRFRNFLHNYAKIARLNAELREQGRDEVHGINGFSDMSESEWRSMYTCRKEVFPSEGASLLGLQYEEPALLPTAAPTKYDWRQHGATTPVKNQGQCGSCWAFSATEGVESANFMAGNKLTVLAPQQITSCDKTCAGCNGGDLPPAYTYIEQNGMETEADYPYTSGTTGITGACNYNKAKVVQTIKSYAYATKTNNETQMYEASATYGPLSVCVDAANWSSYRSGIVTNNCGTLLDHCVQIVGWDTTYSTPYWIVKNSWGSTWGESGYIRIEMFKDLCGIAKEATYCLA